VPSGYSTELSLLVPPNGDNSSRICSFNQYSNEFHPERRQWAESASRWPPLPYRLPGIDFRSFSKLPWRCCSGSHLLCFVFSLTRAEGLQNGSSGQQSRQSLGKICKGGKDEREREREREKRGQYKTVKVKLFLCLTKYQAMEMCWEGEI